MTPDPADQEVGGSDLSLGHRATRVGIGVSMTVGALVYAWFAAGTRPFSASADVMTAVPYGALSAVWLAGTIKTRRGRLGPATSISATEPSRAGSLLPWVTVIALIIVVELITYFAGSSNRHAYPTISSFYDTAARWRPAKALIFFLWLALGWEVARR